MVLSNPHRPDNPLEVVNALFCDLTGYAEGEIVGRNCRFLSGPDTDPAATDVLRAAIHKRSPVLADILNYRSDGTTFRNGVMITPIYDGDGGAGRYFIGTQMEVPRAAVASAGQAAARRVGALSPRQRQVLQAMARGLLNKQIAWELKISEKTVKMHRALLIERLEVGTSAEAIRIAVEAGL